MLASPRGLSQLATSFIAFLRLGIHTHALSSLTIKFTLHTLHATQADHPNLAWNLLHFQVRSLRAVSIKFVLYYARQYSIVKDRCSRFEKRRSQTRPASRHARLHRTGLTSALLSDVFGFDLVGLGRFELPTSPLSGVRSNQLSYRPV